MAINRVHVELAKVIKQFEAATEEPLNKIKGDVSGHMSYIEEVSNIIKKELTKLRRLGKAKRAAGLESLHQRLPKLVEGKTNYSRNGESIRDATIIVDKTIEISNGNDTLNSTLTQTVKRSSRLASKTTTIIKTRRQRNDEEYASTCKKKRYIDDEVDLTKSNCKRAKLKSESESEVFKKPKPLRGRRKNAEDKSVIDVSEDGTIGDEDSFFDSNVLHSSPKVDVPASRKESPKPSSIVVEVKTPSVKETVAAFERLGSEAGSSSTPRKDLVKNLLSKNHELNKNSVEKKKEKVKNTKRTLTPESQDSQDEDVIMDTDDESKNKTDDLPGLGSKKPTRKESRSLFDSAEKKSPPKKEENLNVTRPLQPEENQVNLNVTQTLNSKLPTPEGKQENLNSTKNLRSKVSSPDQKQENLNATRTLCSKVPTPEGKHENLNATRTLRSKVPTPEGKQENLNATRTLRSKVPTPEGKQDNLNATRTLRSKLPSPEAQNDLNKTQTIPAASKRTKPVLKSRIFDSDGNNMLNVNDCKVVVKPVELGKKDPVFVAPAPVVKAPVRKSNRIQSDSETENYKSDSEVTKPRKRRSSELSEPEPGQASKTKKKSNNGKRKNSQAHSDGEIEAPQKKSLPKVVKNEAVSQGDVMDVEMSEAEPAARPKRTRTVRQAAVKDDGEVEIPVPKASKRTKPPKAKEDEFQQEPARSTRTKTLKTAQMNVIEENKLPVISTTIEVKQSPDSTRRSDIENQSPIPVKKRTKMNKKKEVDEGNVILPEEGGRITRTKSKAVKKQNAEEDPKRNSSLTMAARKSLNWAKLIAVQKSQLEKLEPKVCITPEKGFSNYLSSVAKLKLMSTSKNQVLMNSTNKMQPVGTPMSGVFTKFPQPISSTNKKVDNSSTGKTRFMFHPPQSVGKEGSTRKPNRSNSSVDSVVKSVTKVPKKDELLEKQLKLQSKMEKEEEARLKREMQIKNKQEEIKKKNEMKTKMASKQREKLELEKHKNIVQLEKEKEDKHKLILEERKMKLKEEAMRKKMITNKKLNEVEERRRLEEEMRLAKIKEQEAEQQRIQLEKQKEIERNEKRAQERAAEKKLRELYEQKQKEELAKEKALQQKKAMQLQSANKQQKRIQLGMAKREWNYKPRNENDYGLEDENSEVDSGDEEPEKPEKPYPAWAKGVMDKKYKLVTGGQLELMITFMTCYKKTPDIDRMFKMTPSKRIKRTSSAIWNTPSS